MLYDLILISHSWVRWVALIAGILAFVLGVWGWVSKREWTTLDDRAGLIYTISMDIQLLLGIILYFISPLVQFNSAGMQDSTLRFFTVEHLFLMVIAVVFAHVGRAMAKRADDPVVKHRRSAIWYGLSLLSILAAIPWPFRFEGRPWFRF